MTDRGEDRNQRRERKGRRSVLYSEGRASARPTSEATRRIKLGMRRSASLREQAPHPWPAVTAHSVFQRLQARQQIRQEPLNRGQSSVG